MNKEKLKEEWNGLARSKACIWINSPEREIEFQELLDFWLNKLVEAVKEEGERVVEMIEDIENNKWKDAEHCSCLGYAIDKLKKLKS